jgi:8-oxo-dGTP diphosphatase
VIKIKREYPDHPLVGVGAVIVQNRSVLLVKRGQAPLKNRWSLPGGMVELGESVREAAAREVREETGLHVEVGQLLGVFDRVLRDNAGRIQYHYVLVDFLCRIASGELKAAGDALDARWFTRGELTALELAADTLKLIEDAMDMEG